MCYYTSAPVACPFFDPVAPRSSAADPAYAMLPLGDSWRGRCLADPHVPAVPDDHTLHHLCNLGYARLACSRFPGSGGPQAPDAIRFSLVSAGDGPIRIRWSAECDHRPCAHGSLDYGPLPGVFTPPPGLACVGRLGAAYASSFLRRTQALSRR